jgi:hypothetical protein
MMSTGYTPKTDDVFHAVGYTNRDIIEGAQFRLLDVSRRAMMENHELWKELGPLASAMQSGTVKREFIEVLSVTPFLGESDMPYKAPNNEMYLSIEYLSDAALRLCREYGIEHPPVIEKVRRADIPGQHGTTLRTVSYRRA